MTVTVRLVPELHHQLESYCRKHGVSKSHVITELLRRHLSSESPSRRSLYEDARKFGLVGAFSSEKGDLAENRKRYLKEVLRAKHAR